MIAGIFFEKGRQHEDIFWSYQVIGRASHVSLIAYVGYFYLQRLGSIMGKGYTIKRLDALEAIEQRYGYIRKNFPLLEREAKISILSNCIYQGQLAIKNLRFSERKQVFAHLNNTVKRYSFQHSDYRDRKLLHRIWFDLSRISLSLACHLRNTFRIGL